jgi:hypothetical protein
MLRNKPPRPAAHWSGTSNLADDGAYTLAFEGDTWTLTNHLTGATPDVTISTNRDAWTRYLMTPAPERPSAPTTPDSGRRRPPTTCS